jgi:hypothetical protein
MKDIKTTTVMASISPTRVDDPTFLAANPASFRPTSSKMSKLIKCDIFASLGVRVIHSHELYPAFQLYSLRFGAALPYDRGHVVASACTAVGFH